MRTRAILAILTASLAASLGAGGCQYIAQLNVLEVSTGGAGTSGTPACLLADAGGGSCVSVTQPPCPMCSDGTCSIRCSAQMCPEMVPSSAYPTIVTCDTAGSCSGRVFTCMGSNLCELDCLVEDACVGTTLNCAEGPCRMTCAGKACLPADGGVPADGGMPAPPTMTCGAGGCDLRYFGPMGMPLPVKQDNCSAPCCTQERTGG